MPSDLYPGDTVETVEDANHAAIEQGHALEIRSQLIKSRTRYYYQMNGEWRTRLSDHPSGRPSNVDAVRSTIQRSIKRGSVMVVSFGKAKGEKEIQ